MATGAAMIIEHDLQRAPAARDLRGAQRCRRKFLRFFPDGFRDPTYLDFERDYKWQAHEQWLRELAPDRFRGLLRERRYAEIASHAVRIESRTNLLFSFEKMALRDGLRSSAGARTFAEGLYDWLHGRGTLEHRFEDWCAAVAALPRRQTRVLTWPLATVFGFLALPDQHFFLKPVVTRAAFRLYGSEFAYRSRPSPEVYAHLLETVEAVRRDLRDLRPRDLIDIQSFLWVQGSSEYDE
jgi:hypothetical protein